MRTVAIGLLLLLLAPGIARADGRVQSELEGEIRDVRGKLTVLCRHVEALAAKRAALVRAKGWTLALARDLSGELRKSRKRMLSVRENFQRLGKAIASAGLEPAAKNHFKSEYAQVCQVARGFARFVGGEASGNCLDRVQPPQCDPAACEECLGSAASGNVYSQGLHELGVMDCRNEALLCQIIGAANEIAGGDSNVELDDDN